MRLRHSGTERGSEDSSVETSVGRRSAGRRAGSHARQPHTQTGKVAAHDDIDTMGASPRGVKRNQNNNNNNNVSMLTISRHIENAGNCIINLFAHFQINYII